MAAVAAAFAPLVGNAVAGGSNIIASLGSTGIQSMTSLKMQENEQNYNKSVMDRAEKAYTDVGLPKFQAYSGNSGANQLPGQQFHMRGSNYYSAGIVGQNVPFLSTPYQSFTHTGQPTQSRTSKDLPSQPGENGRVRAGFGMYSAVKPWNEPGPSNELTHQSYFDLPINRAFMNQLNQRLDEQGNMQTLPKTNWTRTNFTNPNPVINHPTRDVNVPAHQSIASEFLNGNFSREGISALLGR